MGHQIVIYGMIEGASLVGERIRTLQTRNEEIIQCLPDEDEWPWLTREMFAVPGKTPQGTYREQIIHFGLTLKDDPSESIQNYETRDRECVAGWVAKFEKLLSQLYWISVNLHIHTDFEPDRVFYYLPTTLALDNMYRENPQSIHVWERIVEEMPGRSY